MRKQTVPVHAEMVGGCLLVYVALLLLQVLFHDVEASRCQSIIHKKVGDTVELPSCLPAKDVTSAKWKYKDDTVANIGSSGTKYYRFTDRVSVNQTNLSLTLRKLTLQDSGDFMFISFVNNKQRDSVVITLEVHEPITKEPVLTLNSTWDASNKSCTVLVECRSTSDSNVSYNWTVRNQTLSGSRLQYKLRPEDGETIFTCTVFHSISDKSASTTVKCSNDTSVPGSRSDLFLLRIIGILPFTALLGSLIHYTKSKDKCCNRLQTSSTQTVKKDETQQPVYSSLLQGDGCVYESARGPEEAKEEDRMKTQEEREL
ncbi:SLAM family member 9-like isoform X1 [Channa argus]|uniref:SLAM family member 9-like isoform X1 n=1 Tax=Channa argus TaxID=215402 RepID=UPI0035216C7E